VPGSNRFSPRIGLAFSPGKSDRWLGRILGRPKQTSIRAGYGIYHSVVQGNTIAFDEPQPPYGLSYTSSAPPLFATPFTNATGETNTNPFPLTFVRYGASATDPLSGLNYSQYEPIQGMTAPPPANTFPYTEQYFLSIEREAPAVRSASLALVCDINAPLPVCNLIGKSLDEPFILGIRANRSTQMRTAKGLVVGAVTKDDAMLADQALPELVAIDRARQAEKKEVSPRRVDVDAELPNGCFDPVSALVVERDGLMCVSLVVDRDAGGKSGQRSDRPRRNRFL
jgi:hypothetical protein